MILKPNRTYISNTTIELNQMSKYLHLNDMPPNMKAALTKELKLQNREFNYASMDVWVEWLECLILTPEIKTEIAALLLSGKHE